MSVVGSERNVLAAVIFFFWYSGHSLCVFLVFCHIDGSSVVGEGPCVCRMSQDRALLRGYHALRGSEALMIMRTAHTEKITKAITPSVFVSNTCWSAVLLGLPRN